MPVTRAHACYIHTTNLLRSFFRAAINRPDQSYDTVQPDTSPAVYEEPVPLKESHNYESVYPSGENGTYGHQSQATSSLPPANFYHSVPSNDNAAMAHAYHVPPPFKETNGPTGIVDSDAYDKPSFIPVSSSSQPHRVAEGDSQFVFSATPSRRRRQENMACEYD